MSVSLFRLLHTNAVDFGLGFLLDQSAAFLTVLSQIFIHSFHHLSAGVPYKTFGYINISISDANLKKCKKIRLHNSGAAQVVFRCPDCVTRVTVNNVYANQIILCSFLYVSMPPRYVIHRIKTKIQ